MFLCIILFILDVFMPMSQFLFIIIVATKHLTCLALLLPYRKKMGHTQTSETLMWSFYVMVYIIPLSKLKILRKMSIQAKILSFV